MSHKQFSTRLDILDDLPLPEYTITSYGVRTQFPIIPADVLLPVQNARIQSDPTWALLCECETHYQHVYLALLRCQDAAGHLIALPLCVPTNAFKEDAREVFLVGTRVDACTTCTRPYRTWSVSPRALARVRSHIVVAELRVRRSPLRALALLGPRFIPKQMKIARVVLQSRCVAALAAQGYQLGAPQRADNPLYRVHAFTFLRATRTRGCARLTVRVMQCMQRGSDAVEFRVGNQVSELACEEVMDRDSPLLPVAFVDLEYVNRRPGAWAVPIPGGMAWSEPYD
ncbi:uncharacterized protein TRAVEDRAFT_22602 [Trametes versicolor FP-101664 SS1]|uniref:uncharacterized protein n=1 Tax=Trametes versicolor (strain FP-101664) TaxID=717944 RepID=UPI0004621BD2|nr:uncharacterized protein TRAVEDRAFT_22602 [Trametes versicolor FP-101664 SS1]EIW54684.1 hypothetical protein TRAVEDRAFT_22602 [Trametes versicolor FP-101664 SS1]